MANAEKLQPGEIYAVAVATLPPYLLTVTIFTMTKCFAAGKPFPVTGRKCPFPLLIVSPWRNWWKPGRG